MRRSWRFRERRGGPLSGTRVTTTSPISPDSISRRLSVLLPTGTPVLIWIGLGRKRPVAVLSGVAAALARTMMLGALVIQLTVLH
jgi:hypothetical protein